LKILYEDKDIVIAEKPVNIPTQADQSGDEDMVSLLKKHYGDDDVYIGLHHRLDRNVGGLLAFAKTKLGNKTLSDQIQNRSIEKNYLAVVCGSPSLKSGELRNYIKKLGSRNVSKVVSKSTHGGKLAVLKYTVLETIETDAFGILSLLKITLETGRHHQIRIQLAHEGVPIVGDSKYNTLRIPNVKSLDLSLWAYQLRFRTVDQKMMTCYSTPTEHDGFNYFEKLLNEINKA